MVGLFRLSIWVMNPSAGPRASQLRPSDKVVTVAEVVATLADKSAPVRKLELDARTRCVVVSDPTGDEDDCYGNYDRLITVKVDEGDHRGDVVTIPRGILRVK
jgi:hypothetical protein